MGLLSNEDFITKSKNKHGNKFDYSDVCYKGYKEKVKLTCLKHGSFETTASNHLTSQAGGCKKCVLILNGESHKKDTNHFIKKAKEIHGDFYDYSKSNYTHSLNPVEIICLLHGPFIMKASNHINNKQGCPKCGNTRTKNKNTRTLNSFIEQISMKENFNKYDFSNIVQFDTMRSKIYPTCLSHGKYITTPSNVINSKYFGCNKCKKQDDRFTTEKFIEISKNIHGDSYNYDNADYTTAHTTIKVTCPKHGDYECKPYNHMAGKGFCPKCTDFVSSYEMEIFDYLKNIGVDDVENTVRRFENIKEIDIFSEIFKVGIEFNGLYWHSEIFKEKNYHITKTNILKKCGYDLIHIFEDEWVNKKHIWKSILKNRFGKIDKKIHARNTTLKELSYKDSEKFLNDNHLQGNCVSKYRFGLFLNDELVSVMTFGKLRKNMGLKNVDNEFELLRFCNKINTTVVGGASKIFNHFIKHINPARVISFSDTRYSKGCLYEKLGFDKKYETPPNYYYFKGLRRYNRFTFRKDVLISKGFSKEKTEKEIMKDLGYNRIYDCGNGKYEWINKLKNL